VKIAYLIVFVVVLAAISSAQAAKPKELQFDLAKIGLVLDGQQICEDKSRLQDYPSKVMDQIIAGGPKSVPVLIGMITDEGPLNTTEPITCYWYGMAIGDLAFCLLSDLFTSPTDEKTMPGTGWNDMLGPNDNHHPASDRFNDFVEKHGRKALQVKWQKLWDRYGKQMYWDPKERCFKLRT